MPAGWTAENGGQTISKHPNEPGEVGFNSYVVTEIYSDACSMDDALKEVGPAVDDLASALIGQPGPAASAPMDISLGGYAGKRIVLTVPADLDLATCRLGNIGLQIWLDEPGDKYLVLLADGTATIYIVDVNGERQVFSTQHRAGSSAEDITEMEAIIASIEFEP
jgi:hypothetical protein